MKRSTIIVSVLLILSGCSSTDAQFIEGGNATEKTACQLVKELAIYQDDAVSKFSELECEFFDEHSETIVINLKPTKEHPNYQFYTEMIERHGDESNAIKNLIGVLPNKKVIMIVSNNPFENAFVKEGNIFRKLNQEEALELINQQ